MIIAFVYNLILRLYGLPLLYYAPKAVDNIKNAKVILDTHSYCENSTELTGDMYVLNSDRTLYTYRYCGYNFNHENILESNL